MKFFLDTASLADIRAAVNLGVLDGVTTSPALLAQEGIRGTNAVMAHYRKICELVQVPVTRDGVKAIRYFSDKGIRTNCTLVFSAGQALLAAKAGATYVSPGVGQLDDTGADGLALVGQVVEIFANYGYETEVLAASVRHVPHLIECAGLGADAVACPLHVLTGLLYHPLTDKGLAGLPAGPGPAAAG